MDSRICGTQDSARVMGFKKQLHHRHAILKETANIKMSKSLHTFYALQLAECRPESV